MKVRCCCIIRVRPPFRFASRRFVVLAVCCVCAIVESVLCMSCFHFFVFLASLCRACLCRACEARLGGNDSAPLPRHFGRRDHKQEVSMVAAAVPFLMGPGERRGVIQGELSTASREDVCGGRWRGGGGAPGWVWREGEAGGVRLSVALSVLPRGRGKGRGGLFDSCVPYVEFGAC